MDVLVILWLRCGKYTWKEEILKKVDKILKYFTVYLWNTVKKQLW